MTVPYDGVLFKYSVFLVLCNRLAAVIFGLAMAVAKGEKLTNQAPLWKYLIVSLSNVYASTCQYEALKYVSFAVQMLGKSFKMMPVMIWGMIISGKSYGLRDWGVALAVTLGCTEFLMTGPTNSKVDSGNSMWGFVLLGGLKAQDAADCAACVTALLGKVHGLVVAKVARTAPSLAPGLAAGRTMPGTLRALHTALLFEGQPSGGTTTPVQAMMQNPESKMEGQVHWPDQEGCYAGCAADSMAGGKTYGAPLPSGALAPRRQKVCDMLGRITGAYQGKFCQGPDACVTALPRDFGQVTGATFCPKGDCGEKAGRPWCVSPQTRWVSASMRERVLRVIVWKNAPDTRLLKRSGVGLKMSEARLWATTGQLVNPSDFAAEGTDVTSSEARRMTGVPFGTCPTLGTPFRPVQHGLYLDTCLGRWRMRMLKRLPPTRSQIPHPKQRIGNKPGGDKSESYENREEGGSGRLGDEEEDSMPLLAGLLGPPGLSVAGERQRRRRALLGYKLEIAGQVITCHNNLETGD
eukprot:g24833.t1